MATKKPAAVRICAHCLGAIQPDLFAGARCDRCERDYCHRHRLDHQRDHQKLDRWNASATTKKRSTIR